MFIQPLAEEQAQLLSRWGLHIWARHMAGQSRPGSASPRARASATAHMHHSIYRETGMKRGSRADAR